MSKRLKSLITNELTAQFKGHESIVIVDYSGIDAIKTNRIRHGLRARKARITVVRNALAGKALDAVGLKGAESLLTGTNAIVYGGESIVDLVKELVEQAKDIEQLKIKGSIVEGRLLSVKDTQALAKLPSKAELQSMLVGQILGPGRKLAGQIKGPAGKLASQIKKHAQNQEKAAPAAA